MIVALAGRRIDESDANYVRFPLGNVQLVRERLRQTLTDINCQAIVCAGACGSDLIALDIAGELGLHRIMLLPYAPEVFKEKSVVDRPGNWGTLFDKIFSELSLTKGLKFLDYSSEDIETYRNTNLDILMEAKNISNGIVGVTAIIIWEGHSRGENDITELFSKQASQLDIPVKEVITLQ